MTTRTPLNATVVVIICVLILALALPLITLAKLTSFITLSVFTLMCLSLWRVKVISPEHAGFKVPLLVPVFGSIFSAGFIFYQIVVVLMEWMQFI